LNFEQARSCLSRATSSCSRPASTRCPSRIMASRKTLSLFATAIWTFW
jgi:hypothetical protein